MKVSKGSLLAIIEDSCCAVKLVVMGEKLTKASMLEYAIFVILNATLRIW